MGGIVDAIFGGSPDYSEAIELQRKQMEAAAAAQATQQAQIEETLKIQRAQQETQQAEYEAQQEALKSQASEAAAKKAKEAAAAQAAIEKKQFEAISGGKRLTVLTRGLKAKDEEEEYGRKTLLGA